MADDKMSTLDVSGSSSEYIVYANADICIPKYFFEFVFQQIALCESVCNGYTSFIVNRKDILRSNDPNAKNPEILMHPGYDLFVFHAKILSKLSLGEVAIGTPPVGCVLAINLANYSENAKVLNDVFITWHRGRDQYWKHLKVERSRNQASAKYAIQELSNCS